MVRVRAVSAKEGMEMASIRQEISIAALLPDEMAATIRAMIEQGMAVMKKTLEA